MSVRRTATRQYARIVDGAAEQIGGLRVPPEGWLATVRKALGMSAPQVARRAGVTKAAIYQAQRKELAGGITIRQLEKLARALGGRVVYAIVPDQGNVDDRLRKQARVKAENLVRRASAHMALEKQSLPEQRIREQIEGLTSELARDLPADLWDDP